MCGLGGGKYLNEYYEIKDSKMSYNFVNVINPQSKCECNERKNYPKHPTF